jgi:hypothetical protein
MSLSLSGRKLYRVNVHVDCHQPEKTPADVRARDLIKFLVLAKPEDKVSSLKKDVVQELKSFPRSLVLLFFVTCFVFAHFDIKCVPILRYVNTFILILFNVM